LAVTFRPVLAASAPVAVLALAAVGSAAAIVVDSLTGEWEYPAVRVVA
jgi:hypothetical protein